MHDFLRPDRIFIGADDRVAAERVASLYASLDAPVLLTDPASAETIKYAANAFLSTKVSFANAVAAMCEAIGADVADVIGGLGSDHRIGHHFLRPGPGCGGSCLPKDTRALVTIVADYGYDFALVRGVIAVNDEQRHRIVEKVRAAVGGTLDGATIAVLGLTFKAHTDDLRESPSIAIVSDLVDSGAKIRSYDPTVTTELAQAQQTTIGPVASALQMCDDALDAAAGPDAVAVLTEWPEFAALDLARLASVMPDGATIVDARNLLAPAAMRAAGLAYDGVGRR